MGQRNYKVDILRSVASILLILAHVNPPHFIGEVRTFDVVLLAILSGISVSYSHGYDYKGYLMKRFKRLVLPTYACMAIVFCLSALVCLILHREQLYSLDVIVASLFFSDKGMGYIWIVKVYLIMAIFAYLLLRIDRFIKSDYLMLMLIGGGILIQVLVLKIDAIRRLPIFDDYIAYILPYLIFELIGIRWTHNSKKFQNGVLLSSAVALVILCIILNGFEPSSFKYPPTHLYIIYGIFASGILLTLVPNKRVLIFEYLSKKSFDIYLVHIVVMLVYSICTKVIHIPILQNWIVKFIIIAMVSVLSAEMMDRIKRVIVQNTKWS